MSNPGQSLFGNAFAIQLVAQKRNRCCFATYPFGSTVQEWIPATRQANAEVKLIRLWEAPPMPSANHSARRGPVLSVQRLEDRTTPSSSTYIASMYTNLLHRAPSAAEVAGWAAQLDSGMPALAITTAFVRGREYQDNFIRSCYQLFFSRQPSAAEVSGWAARLAMGASDPQIQGEMLTSSEFFQDHPGDSSTWINAVYEQMLGRSADPGGLASLNMHLQQGASFLVIAQATVSSPEATTRVITDAYHQLLGRDPDAGGLGFYTSWVEQGNSPLAGRSGADPSVIALDRRGCRIRVSHRQATGK